MKDADSPLAQDEIRKEVVWKNADKPRAPRQKNAGHNQKINSNRYFSRKYPPYSSLNVISLDAPLN